MKRNFLFLIFTIIVLAVSCSKDNNDITSLEIKPSDLSIVIGQQERLEAVLTPAGFSGEVKWWSDNSKVATVDQTGCVSAFSVGKTKIHAKCGEFASVCSVTVIEKGDPGVLPDSYLDPREALAMPLTNSMIFSKGVQLIRAGNVMQGWDFTDLTHFYYAQSPDGVNQYISFCPGPSKSYSNYMTLDGFGHMTQIVAEASTDGDTYIWCNSNGNWDGSTYGGNMSISRFKYTPGATLQYYSGRTFVMSKKYNGKDFFDLQVGVDFKYRRLLIGARVKGVSIRFHWVFDLDEVLALQEKDVSLTLTTPSGTGVRTLKACDLNDCKVLGYFEVPRGTNPEIDTYYYSHQGHEVYGKYVWFYEGSVDTTTTPYTSVAYVTVYDYNGKVVIPRTKVAALNDNNAFISTGFTYDGNAEGESMKIKNGILYLGFACHSAATSRNRIQNILYYTCKTK